MVELRRGEVDVDPQRAAVGVPGLPEAGLAHGLLEHPAAERHDQAGVLGERDEAVGAEHPVLRVAPADQRLRAVHAAVPEVDERLVLDEELAALQGGRQGGGEAVPGDGAGVGLGVGELEAVAARRLGPVHGDVGAAQHLGRGPLPRRALDHAEAAAHGQLAAVDAQRGGEGGEDAVGEVGDVPLAAGAGGEGHELVPAEPGHHLVGPGDAALQPVRDLHEEPVAGGVAEAVVDDLEAVEVEVAEAEAGVVAGGERLLQSLEEQGPVGESGEGVVGGLVAQAQMEQAPLGGVLQEGQLVLGAAVGVPEERDGEVGPQNRSVTPVVRFFHPVVLPLAADQLLVQPPDVRPVLRVDPLADLAAAQPALHPAEHAGEGLVDLQEVAVEVGDADADGGPVEDRAEAALGGVQGDLGGGAGGERGAGDGLLLGEGPLAQGLGVAGGHAVLEPGAAGPELFGRQVRLRTAVEHQVRVDDAEAAAERVRVGAVCGDQGRAGALGRGGVEGPGVQGVVQGAGRRQQVHLELGPGERRGGHREDRAAPDGDEPPESVLRAVGLGAGTGRLGRDLHALRPTPARPEKVWGSSSSTGLSGRQTGSGTRPGSSSSVPSKKRATSAPERITRGLRMFR